MRKVFVFPLLALTLGLAACGGGGSSSSGTTSVSADASPETAWGKEVEKVMRRFENQVSANATEQIHTTSSQALVEPMYRAYGAALTKLGDELGATDAPPACVALRKRMVDDAHALGQLTTKLGRPRGPGGPGRILGAGGGAAVEDAPLWPRPDQDHLPA